VDRERLESGQRRLAEVPENERSGTLPNPEHVSASGDEAQFSPAPRRDALSALGAAALTLIGGHALDPAAAAHSRKSGGGGGVDRNRNHQQPASASISSRPPGHRPPPTCRRTW
jgi:hypothetical protein